MEERFLWMDWCLVGGKKKKILGFCKINDCVMWNYNVFMFFCELKFLEFLKLIKMKIN